MLLWKGEQKAGPGTYWNMNTGERVELEKDDVLPGDSATGFIKAPSSVMLLSGPLLGVMYAMFLPLVGIIMTISFLAKKIAGIGKRAGQRIADAAGKSAFFGWRPLHAFFISKRKGGKRKKDEAR
ncbi:MAG TPA: hypothetical protein VK654_12265 [Nitrospirota bacterium]|nr:hypothetical protein [Nitrospirota bacterium]